MTAERYAVSLRGALATKQSRKEFCPHHGYLFMRSYTKELVDEDEDRHKGYT
jgi:hypothetical protein